MEGGTLGVWSNTYNDTITGDAVWKYPEFKGYFGDVRWVQFQTTEGPITAVMGQDDLFLQVLTPKFPQNREARNTVAAVPGGRPSRSSTPSRRWAANLSRPPEAARKGSRRSRRVPITAQSVSISAACRSDRLGCHCGTHRHGS